MLYLNGTFCLGTLKLTSVCFVCNFFYFEHLFNWYKLKVRYKWNANIFVSQGIDVTETHCLIRSIALCYTNMMWRRHLARLGELHFAIPKCKSYFLHWCIMYVFFLHFYRCFVFYSERDIYKHNWMPITSYLHVFVICYKFNLLYEFSIYNNSVNPVLRV